MRYDLKDITLRPPPYVSLGSLQVMLLGKFFVFSAGDLRRGGNRAQLMLGEITSFSPTCTCSFFQEVQNLVLPCHHPGQT